MCRWDISNLRVHSPWLLLPTNSHENIARTSQSKSSQGIKGRIWEKASVEDRNRSCIMTCSFFLSCQHQTIVQNHQQKELTLYEVGDTTDVVRQPGRPVRRVLRGHEFLELVAEAVERGGLGSWLRGGGAPRSDFVAQHGGDEPTFQHRPLPESLLVVVERVVEESHGPVFYRKEKKPGERIELFTSSTATRMKNLNLIKESRE